MDFEFSDKINYIIEKSAVWTLADDLHCENLSLSANENVHIEKLIAENADEVSGIIKLNIYSFTTKSKNTYTLKADDFEKYFIPNTEINDAVMKYNDYNQEYQKMHKPAVVETITIAVMILLSLATAFLKPILVIIPTVVALVALILFIKDYEKLYRAKSNASFNESKISNNLGENVGKVNKILKE